MSDVAIWGSAVATLAHVLAAVYLFMAWRGGIAGGALLIAMGVTALWGLAGASGFSLSPETVLVLQGGAEILRTAAWYLFLLILLRPLYRSSTRWHAAIAATVVVSQSLGFAAALSSASAGFEAYRLLLGCYLAGTVFGLVLVEQLYRGLPVESRWGLKPLCLGLSAGYIFDLYLVADGFLFGRLDPDVLAVRGLVLTMLIPLVVLSASRSPAWTVRVAVSREMAFHSTALALSGLYLLMIAGAGYYVRYFGGGWGRALQLGLLFGGLLLLGVFIFSGTQRAKLRVFLNKHLFPYRYDYRAEWLRFTHALSSAGDSLDLGQSVIKALSDLVESSGGGLWLRNTGGRFTLHARLNHSPSDAVEEADSPFCRFIDEHEWVVNLEEVRGARGRQGGLVIPAWLAAMDDAWLVVPLKSGGGLVGFVVLNSARTPFEVDWEVLDLLKTAQRQAASFLARMLAAEALLEARKFDSFHRMSAFVVHDLKNLVAQLSLMLKNAERHRDNPAFQEDMLETVTHVESRMRALMQQLQGKKPIESERRVGLRTTLLAVRDSKRMQRPPVALDMPEGEECYVYANPERLQRVIGHLVQNALDATPEDGKVSMSLDTASAGRARIGIEDTGCGMSPEFLREKLFKPFQSSKASGMGIGMYETQQYVQEIGGVLQVESVPGRGTRVVIDLSVADRLESTQPAVRTEFDHDHV